MFRDTSSTGFDPSGKIVGTVAFVGTFSATAFRQLSFTVDTTSGAVTDVSLVGSSADYSSLLGTTFFTDAATKYLGVGASSAVSSRWGQIDNISVVAVPEPGAGILCGLALTGLMLRRRRARLRPANVILLVSTTPFSPPSNLRQSYDRQAGSTQWLFQEPLAESKFLAFI